jgi:UDP-glucose 4-epimerase
MLVTGGAGFIGSHLCDELILRGHHVWCVDNLHLGRKENICHLNKNDRFHFHNIDLLERKALDALFREARFDAVFHLAANSDIQKGSQDHKVDLNLNFLSTYELLEAMLRNGTKQIFFASTSAIFGETEVSLNEDYGPVNPVSFYGATKLAAEAFLSVFVNNYGFKSWILRFPNVVGERCTHGAVHDFISRLKRDPTQLTVLGNGSQCKPYLYVGDIIRAAMIVFEKADEPLAVYHAGNGDRTSVKDMAEIVVEEMGLKSIPINYTGGDRGWIGDVPFFTYDMKKIKSLGWTPLYSSTESVRLAVRRILGKE